MTRRQKVWLCAVILLAVIFSVWPFTKRALLTTQHPDLKKDSASPQAGVNQVNSPVALAMSTAATPGSTSVETQQRRFVEAFNTPITFFGEVTDQNGAPVVSADVQIAANDKAFGGKPSQYSTKTDTLGKFSLSGIKGITLAIEVSKPGYRVVPPADNRTTSSGVFNYGLSSIRGQHRPDPDNPVRFVLYKIGPTEVLYRVGPKDYQISQDGSPLLVSLDRAGTHQVMLRCWNNSHDDKPVQRQYDWRAEVAPVKGAVIAKGDKSFEAPLDGYVSKDSIEMPASLPREEWHSWVDRSYFLRFEDGVFASAKVQIHSRGDRFVTWESSLNVTPGSRNLESDK